jgi:GTP-binding protein HflX
LTSPSQHSRRNVLLVGLVTASAPPAVAEEHLDELAELAGSAGAQVVGRVLQRRPSPDPATFIGSGKVEDVRKQADELGAGLILFDDDLSGGQQRNLEKALARPVMDRSGLILDIFEQRARTREAKTQVELARLQYALPRLVKQWSHLSRQGGGIGQRGGEGESQLEADRRVIRQKIVRLEKDLERIDRTRETQRRGRSATSSVALAGYTNAGKSTLFNALTQAGTLAENRLFATLDAKMRRWTLSPGRSVVVADTVGFIRKLPHHLVASFRSTLSEAAYADLVLHVVDRSHPHWEEQATVAEEVLTELGVRRENLVTVWNKSDRLGSIERRDGDGVWISALTGEGLPALARRVEERLFARRQEPAQRRAAENELVVLVDDDDRELDYVLKAAVHTSATPLHRGFSLFVFDGAGRLLLQQRAFHKLTWPGVWSNSVCGHPAPGETSVAAAGRRAVFELGLDLEPQVMVPDFRYRAELDGVVENELCPVLVASTESEPLANPDEVAALRWIEWREFVETIRLAPEDWSPWCVLEVERLEREPRFHEWFEASQSRAMAVEAVDAAEGLA